MQFCGKRGLNRHFQGNYSMMIEREHIHVKSAETHSLTPMLNSIQAPAGQVSTRRFQEALLKKLTVIVLK